MEKYISQPQHELHFSSYSSVLCYKTSCPTIHVGVTLIHPSAYIMTKILLDCAQASPVNRGHTAASGLLSKLVVSPVGPALYYYVLYYTQTTLLVIIADDEIRLLLPLAQ